mmetsp:Transcript_29502/g.33931  ORF Transcript_29502/g.33931 Transcript_29502/m.33931 type:complete len:240 (-) Transcript_29502:269-988(-)|eukprot:CAMPEP_0171293498 /NCGR_PEP_ID=MMETSP0816-20121228/1775_1 /TAXON_ID=420281 /ORGANISM="Proboscia inermis, Strain CCAP1064/1" /LENGTH=239 /DNA_ID=CAMNT_0011764421 /DNA_START=90 /DNA_END=809 /DNA_ORIENTATION=+
MKLLIASLLAGFAAAFAPSAVTKTSQTTVYETKADLEVLANKANPIVNYFDPLGLADFNFWQQGNEATIGWIREAEIKHGRVAMFAFIGYIVHANGITFPFPMRLDGTPFPTVSSAPEAWDVLPNISKLQIIAFIGALEFVGEADRTTHYMKGGKPGDFPPLKFINLYDPMGMSISASEEKKSAGLIKEINNGRLAMLGMFGFLSESKIEGSVPFLKGLIPQYDGDYMIPFSGSFFTHV